VRNIRAEMNIKPSERVSLLVSADANSQSIFKANEAQILKLARANDLKLSEKAETPKASVRAVLTGGAELAVPLEGLIDFDKETERLEKQSATLVVEGERLEKQLGNQNFVEKAPPEKVQELRDRVAEIELRLKTLNQTLEALK
jgi:valyl-tRNA synthetase